MKAYLTPEKVGVIQANGNCLAYPHAAKALDKNPLLGKAFLPTEGHEQYCTDPDMLVVEAAHHLGRGNKKVLDFGCGAGKNALYLAANGYSVVAVDPDEHAIKHVRQRARDFGIPAGHLETRVGSKEAIATWETFDAVVATMVLHFMDKTEATATLHRLKEATIPGGFHVVSAYTKDNPTEEMTEYGKQHLFAAGELGTMYGRDWPTKRCAEGISPTPVQRSGGLLLPNVTEVIAVNASYASSRMVLV